MDLLHHRVGTASPLESDDPGALSEGTTNCVAQTHVWRRVKQRCDQVRCGAGTGGVLRADLGRKVEGHQLPLQQDLVLGGCKLQEIW